MTSHSRRLESVQIIISFTFRALAQLNVLHISAGWLILCILEVMEDAYYNPIVTEVYHVFPQVNQANIKIVP